tara:strand:+ start:119 stop:601 length:483 start_codon:yes stop_codon:yes gene_type:complete
VLTVFNLRYEHKISSQQSFYVTGVASNRYAPLSAKLYDPSYEIHDIEKLAGSRGISGGYNFCFNTFDKGWYGGPTLGIFNETLESRHFGVRYRVDNSYYLLGGALGWKRIGKSGFTMNLQFEVAYRTYFAQAPCDFCFSGTSWVSNGLVLKPGFQLGYSF